MGRTLNRKSAQIERKLCQGECHKERPLGSFYKVKSTMFPDGHINICKDCLKKSINVDSLEEVIGFLRQIDKPYIKKQWDIAYANRDKANPIGSYLRNLSLDQFDGKTFLNSDGVDGVGKVDVSSINTPDSVENVKGEMIIYSDKLVDFWGVGYKKNEYLDLEKFFQDMRLTHEIHTPVHINKLKELAYLNIELKRLRQERDIANYTKLAKTIDDMEKSAGFRPVDRQGVDDATGIRSFSQIFEEVEKKGFRKPPKLVFDEDVIDGIVISLANYYHRLVGKQILTEVPEDVKEELEEFYEEDLTPVELNDEEYENLDFTVDESED